MAKSDDKFPWRKASVKSDQERQKALSQQYDDSVAALRQRMATPYELAPGHFISTHYQKDRQDWILHSHLPGLEEPIATGLGVKDPNDFLGAEAEAMEFAGAGLPDIVKESELDQIIEPSVYFSSEFNTWTLWSFCTAPYDSAGCHGFPLVLEVPVFPYDALQGVLSGHDVRSAQRIERAKARSLAAQFVYVVSEAPICFGCLSERMRAEESFLTQAPPLWFDVTTQEWQLFQPLGDQGVSLPLELGGFNRPFEKIIAAAKEISPDFGMPWDD